MAFTSSSMLTSYSLTYTRYRAYKSKVATIKASQEQDRLAQ